MTCGRSHVNAAKMKKKESSSDVNIAIDQRERIQIKVRKIKCSSETSIALIGDSSALSGRWASRFSAPRTLATSARPHVTSKNAGDLHPPLSWSSTSNTFTTEEHTQIANTQCRFNRVGRPSHGVVSLSVPPPAVFAPSPVQKSLAQPPPPTRHLRLLHLRPSRPRVHARLPLMAEGRQDGARHRLR